MHYNAEESAERARELSVVFSRDRSSLALACYSQVATRTTLLIQTNTSY